MIRLIVRGLARGQALSSNELAGVSNSLYWRSQACTNPASNHSPYPLDSEPYACRGLDGMSLGFLPDLQQCASVGNAFGCRLRRGWTKPRRRRAGPDRCRELWGL